jgi:hypothetical protein
MMGASEDDLKLLIAKRFILCFENGVIVIKHWRMHNLLRKDRYNPTQYTEEKALLTIKNDGAYTEKPCDNQLATTCQPNGNQLATQDSIGELSIVEESIVDSPKKETRHKYGAYNNVLLSDTDFEKLKTEFPDYKERIERLSEYIASTGKSYKNHLATIRSWAKKDKAQKSYGSRTTEEKNAGFCFNQNEDSLDDLF